MQSQMLQSGLCQMMAYEAHIKRGAGKEADPGRRDSQPDKESDVDGASCGRGY